MKVGKWYREETINPDNGKSEWKYYYVTEELEQENLAIDVYKVHWNGKLSRKHTSQCHSTALDRCTLVSKNLALQVLGIEDPDQTV